MGTVPQVKPGDVVMGHRYIGGDPADRNSWEKASFGNAIKREMKGFFEGINRPVLNTEGMVKRMLPEQTNSTAKEAGIGALQGTARAVDSMTSPAAIGSMTGLGLLGRVGIAGKTLMGGLSADMLYNAYRNIKDAVTNRSQGTRETSADVTGGVIESLMAALPWLHLGGKSKPDSRKVSRPSELKFGEVTNPAPPEQIAWQGPKPQAPPTQAPLITQPPQGSLPPASEAREPWYAGGPGYRRERGRSKKAGSS